MNKTDLLYIVMETPMDNIWEEKLDVKIFQTKEKAIRHCKKQMEGFLEEGEEIKINEKVGIDPHIEVRFPDDSDPTYIIYIRCMES